MTALDRTRKWLANWQRQLSGAAATTALEGGMGDFVRDLPMVRMTRSRQSQPTSALRYEAFITDCL